MSLRGVKMSSEVWLTCLTHALTTETEEIMGLLLGDIVVQDDAGGGEGPATTALIWGARPQMRSDRRKDRVETNPEALAAASAEAERMTAATGRTTRVIGWYHSHPHITVLPSHVDVRTQAMYQLLDPGFIGLIFSCFSEDAHKIGRIQVIAFQSLDGKQHKVPSPAAPNSIIQLESSWSSSDNVLSPSGSAFTQSFDPEDTGDSTIAKAKKVGGKSSILEESFSDSDVNSLVKQRKRGNSLNADSVHNAAINMDSSDMSPSMQEALHLSNIEMRGAEYVRKEVLLEVLPTRSLLKLDCPLTSFTEMQHVLFEEEQSAYNQALSQNICDGKIHPLTFIHHTSTYQASLCKLIEYCLSPAVNALQNRLKENEIRLAMLMEEAKSLEIEAVGRESERSLGSPRHRPTHGFRGQRDIHSPPDSRSSSGSGSRRKAY